MIEEKVFAKSIKRLGEFYPKFELTQTQLGTWFQYFNKYSYDEFMLMVKLYIDKNEFPPQSPRSLVKYYEEAKRMNYIDEILCAEDAWEEVRKTLRLYSLHHEHSQQDQFFEHLSQFHPIVSECAKLHLSEIRTLKVDDTFVGNGFKKTYNSLLNKEISQLVSTELKQTQIESNNIGLIDYPKKEMINNNC